MTCDLKCVNRILYLFGKEWNLRKPKEFTMMNEYFDYANFIKSQNKNGVLSHPDIQQRMLMMMGNEKNKKLEISKEEEKKIAQTYLKMFFALATIRWCNGETLGVARQKSLDQMNNYVKSKTNIAHPMNKYLLAINGQIHREIAQINMTDENSNKKIEIDPELKKKRQAEATKEFQQCLKTLNEMYQKYMPEKDVKKMPATKSFEAAKQRAQQLMQAMLLQQTMHQKAA